MVYTVKSVLETEALGKSLAEKIEKKRPVSAFIAMRGEMGVGKTAFVRGFASHFEIGGVKSPTYTIVNEYRGRKSIYHFDLYRITDIDDLISVGYDDYVRKNGYCIAEWSENIEGEIPPDAIYVTISRSVNDENERIIEISDF